MRRTQTNLILAAISVLMDFGFYRFLSGLEMVIQTGVLPVSPWIPSMLSQAGWQDCRNVHENFICLENLLCVYKTFVF